METISRDTVSFFLPVPDELPLPPGTSYSFEQETGALVTLTTWQTSTPHTASAHVHATWEAVAEVTRTAVPSRSLQATGGDVEPPSSDTDDTSRTVVQAVVRSASALESPGGGIDHEALSDAFDDCFAALVELVTAYRSATRRLVPTPSHERLPPLLPWLRGRDDGTWEEHWGIFVLHTSVRVAAGDQGADLADSVAFHLAQGRRRHPALAYRQRRLDAVVEVEREGRAAAGIVLAHTAYEVFSDTLVGLVLWEGGATPDEAARFFRSTRSAHQRLSGTGARELKPGWDRRGAPEQLASWYATASRLRHRIVHTGHEPHRTEARAVLDALDRCTAAALTAVADAAPRFPTTAYLLLGAAQLVQHAPDPEVAARWLSAFDEDETLGSVARWIDEVEALRWAAT